MAPILGINTRTVGCYAFSTAQAYLRVGFGKIARKFRRRRMRLGGYGSGGWNRKYAGTTEDHIRLDIAFLKKNGYLRRTNQNRLTWERNGLSLLDLWIKFDGQHLNIRDATATDSPFPDALSQSLAVVQSPRHVGGSRMLFDCPRCPSKRQHLYLIRSRFICRDCAGLTYKVRRERKIARTFRRWEKDSARLGGVCWEGWYGRDRPKGMHTRTYDALCERLRVEETIVNRSMGLFC